MSIEYVKFEDLEDYGKPKVTPETPESKQIYYEEEAFRTTTVKEDNTQKVGKDIVSQIYFEFSNRPIEFYIYLVPTLFVPALTSTLPQEVGAYVSTVFITLYVSAVYQLAR